jgi:hypothetical protein
MEHKFHSIVWIFRDEMEQNCLESEWNEINYNIFISILPLFINMSRRNNKT